MLQGIVTFMRLGMILYHTFHCDMREVQELYGKPNVTYVPV